MLGRRIGLRVRSSGYACAVSTWRRGLSFNPVDGRDVVCVGFNDWDNDVWTNQHHLMARLAASGSRVLFIESLGLRRPQFGSGRDLRRILRRLRRGFSPPQDQRTASTSSRRSCSHSTATPLARRLNAVLLRAAGAAARPGGWGCAGPVLWAYVPQAESLLGTLDPSLVVYHCVDDIAAQSRVDTDSFVAAEERFAARADLVLASAPALAERMRTLSRHVLYAPNVADTATVRGRAGSPGRSTRSWPCCRSRGCCSSARSARSSSTLRCCAGSPRARRGWTIALVGPVGLGDPDTDISELAAEPNIHLLGARAHDGSAPILRARRGWTDPVSSTRS